MNTQRTHWKIGLVLLGSWALATSTLWAQFGGFGGGGGGFRGTGRGGMGNYPSGTEVGTATFTTDPETRKLMVVTDEETAKYISQVVSNLDRPAPQVLIKVVFLEATYRKGVDIGVEGNYQHNNGNTVGNYSQAFRGLPGIDSGQSLYSIAGSDFQVTLRAIAENGKLEVLSRPSILARNNQQATITVGQYVPIVSGVSYNVNLGQINSISYQNVGIILRVTPFITTDNMVEMIVSPEISNLSDETVNISTGTNAAGAPIINTRSADTVVITPNGQTVVIGGLMQNTKTEVVSKVPVLGDIPLLGFAFRRKVKADSKTELLIFLTPYIVKQPGELAAMTTNERNSLRMLPKSLSEDELNRFLETVNAKTNAPPTKK